MIVIDWNTILEIISVSLQLHLSSDLIFIGNVLIKYLKVVSIFPPKIVIFHNDSDFDKVLSIFLVFYYATCLSYIARFQYKVYPACCIKNLNIIYFR